MDPTTAAHTSQPLHHSHLQTGVDSTGMPTLNTGAPYAGLGSQTSPGAPLTSSPSVGTSNLAAPKSSAPAADPIAGLSAPASANSNQSPSTTTDKLNTTAANAKDSALNAKDKAADQASAAATGIRKRLNSISSSVEGAADHPTVKNVKVEAEKQVQGLREQLGRFPIVVEAEKKTGVDRVALVIGGVLLYIIMIPLNLLGLALPTTQLLTFLPPSALAIRTLDRPNEERTKTLLSYFVVFGFVQFAESLMAGFLERKIPQYYTVKLVFLAYLIHPKTKGARKIHASVLRPLLAKAQGQSTSSTTSSSTSTSTYPTTGTHTPPSHTARSSDSSVGAGAGAGLGSSTSPIPVAGGAPQPLSRAGGFSGTGPSEPLPSTGRVAQGFNL